MPSRPVHPRDAHEAAERNGADPILDPVVTHLRDRRGKADVEASRADPDEQCHGEVTELVQEDEQKQSDDDNEPDHATGSLASASARAARSASSNSSRSQAGAP